MYLVTGFASSVAVYWLAGDDGHVARRLRQRSSACSAWRWSCCSSSAATSRQLLVLLALNLVITFASPNISWQAHLGGLAAGLVIGAGFRLRPARVPPDVCRCW